LEHYVALAGIFENAASLKKISQKGTHSRLSIHRDMQLFWGSKYYMPQIWASTSSDAWDRNYENLPLFFAIYGRPLITLQLVNMHKHAYYI
jgi:hypothetical protein